MLKRVLAVPVLGACLFLSATASERQTMLDAMNARPSGLWPRGSGHVVLGLPGSTEDEKAYLEPGGSFSPSFGSFGVQLVVENAEQEIEVASDFVPLRELQQAWVWPRARDIPGVRTETTDYVATWSLVDGKRWRLEATSTRHPRMVVAIRSVGPAGGPLTNAAWDGRSIHLNNRWTITPARAPLEIQLGYLNPTNLTTRETSTAPSRSSPRIVVSHSPQAEADRRDGWGRVVLVFNREATLTFEDNQPPAPNPLTWSTTRSPITLNLPESRFATCLNAQVAQLLMGLVGQETRPGDPNNYPLNWLREGAMIIVALARAGQLEVARQLCEPFAHHDFFGGFGAEADGPGLSLWAITEVAEILNDTAFDQMLRPHVERKLALIDDMLNATGPLRKPWTGPLVPRKIELSEADLVCEAATDGLIWGRLEWHRPVLYVNAATYAGLRQAINYLVRTKDASRARRTAAVASRLRDAWNAALDRAEFRNERNWTCGLHPSWIVRDREAYRSLLQAVREQTHTSEDLLRERPLRTSFNAAVAHQWLLLGHSDRAWRDLHWFWDNQSSPGLYSWWEGNSEENSFDRWETVRGWVNPPYVSPHYGTAAEILLLQLSMLAYLDESGPQPRLVVGAGVPTAWLSSSMSVLGIRTRVGTVSWDWDGRRLRVRAPAFAADSIQPAGAFASAPFRLN